MTESIDWKASLRTRLLPLLPDLEVQALAFRVDTSEVDDEIRDIFRQQLGGLVSVLPQAVAVSDWDSVRRHAHSLQGMSVAVGFPDLSVAGCALSAAVKAPDPARCRQLAEALTSWAREYIDA